MTPAAGLPEIKCQEGTRWDAYSPSPAPAYLYNAQGQLQSITYPDGTVYAYQYNAHGDKIRETTRTGKTWSYVYDQNHYPLTIIDPMAALGT